MSKKRVKKLYKALNSKMDTKNLAYLEDKFPDVVDIIRELVEAGEDYRKIGKDVRFKNPQMWIESKMVESVARAIGAILDQ